MVKIRGKGPITKTLPTPDEDNDDDGGDDDDGG